ncbi:MAG: type II toxin-antitoxin system Phd/YefM family antitoxin [Verrucomicrobia bacterium]|jgi:PHD/YefM family antitoxin component YafN of YafNO toxin-antitoxin module|nr:type II toxin-antitoxin system Phd/YefM family antitoxin [Verrucomicrobiota bacterium]
MAITYSVTEAQAGLPSILREAEEQPVIITRRDKAVGYLLSPERFEAMLETMEIMSNPLAMQAIRDHKSGKTKFMPLDVLDEK